MSLSTGLSPRKQSHRRPAKTWRAGEAILFRPFLLLVMVAPLPLGSNRPFAWSGMSLAMGVLLLLWAARAWREPRSAPLALDRIWPLALPFLALVGWSALQALAPVPAPLAHPQWEAAARALDLSLATTMSLAPADSLTGVMRLLLYGGAFLLAVEFGHRRRSALAMLWAASLAGGAYATYGLVEWFSGNEHLLWLERWDYGDSLTASFVNRNSFATYAGLALVATLALLARGLSPAGRRRRPAGAAEGALVALAILIAAALLLSRSRGGTAAALIGVAALSIAFSLSWGRRAARPFILLILALLAGASWVAGDALALRLDGSEIGWGDRPAIWARALAAIAERPMIGHGLGAYPDVAHLYRDAALAGIDGTIDQAHSTYLELAAEVGAPLAIALVSGFVWLAATCLGGAMRRRRDPAPAAAGFAATMIVGAHAIVDFSLQIPAVTLTYLMLAGAGLGYALHGRTGAVHPSVAVAATKRP